jgi:hypothetical protein
MTNSETGCLARIDSAESLEELLAVIRDMEAEDPTVLDRYICDLPVFGGEDPEDTSLIWSWNETHWLVGACVAEMGIEPRDDVCHWNVWIGSDWLEEVYARTEQGAVRVAAERYAEKHGWELQNFGFTPGEESSKANLNFHDENDRLRIVGATVALFGGDEDEFEDDEEHD